MKPDEKIHEVIQKNEAPLLAYKPHPTRRTTNVYTHRQRIHAPPGFQPGALATQHSDIRTYQKRAGRNFESISKQASKPDQRKLRARQLRAELTGRWPGWLEGRCPLKLMVI